ncbi:MAG TPA: glycerate-2-kinase family protein, partial [Paludibacteraceae bacterium]|nr:glycerate-2-kinase family protein [Paludibacteraceae bacterium]
MKINPKTDIKQIFLSGIESVLPDKLIKSEVRWSNNVLSIQNHSFYLPDFENIFVIGAGKATALMAKEIESILGNYISAGHIVVKYQHKCALNIIEITEAGHPLPDENGQKAAQRILTIAKQAGSHDLVICLFSGGASALLADCPDEISLSDLITTNDLLIKSGASIQEINTVRKHISKLKGGQLAKEIYPAQTVSLILSDVIGDRLDVIASGPTYPDPTTFSEAYEVLKKYELINKVPLSVVQYLKRGIAGEISETPKSDDSIFSKVYNIIIGNNKMALEAAGRKAKELGYQAHVITDNLQSNIEETANFILSTIEKFKE